MFEDFNKSQVGVAKGHVGVAKGHVGVAKGHVGVDKGHVGVARGLEGNHFARRGPVRGPYVFLRGLKYLFPVIAFLRKKALWREPS